MGLALQGRVLLWVVVMKPCGFYPAILPRAGSWRRFRQANSLNWPAERGG